MAKDSFWFKHDSSAGRGTKIRRIQILYGHWGKGVYWDVIEILRDQEDYSYENDAESLRLLAGLIGVNLEVNDQTIHSDSPVSTLSKFEKWYKDCVKYGLFIEVDGKFRSPILSENMSKWEVKKRNGSGKKAERELFESETEANAEELEKRTEEKRTEENTALSSLALFDNFRTAYPGRKRGNDTEFVTLKKHKDWQQVLPTLTAVLGRQISSRAHKKSTGGFVPEWKNLKTWLNQRCWEEEVELPPSKEDKKPEVTHKQMFPQVD